MIEGWIVPEPELSFGKGDRHVDPKAGLAMYGPFAAEGQDTGSVGHLNVGVVGPREALGSARVWLETLTTRIPADKDDPILFPHFPGFEQTFRTRLQIPEALLEEIPSEDIQEVLAISDARERVARAAALYQVRLRHLAVLQPRPNVVVCAVPEDIEDFCWSSAETRVPTKIVRERRRLRELGQRQLLLSDFVEDEEPAPVVVAPSRGTNFRARIKSAGMEATVPTQILRETTLSGRRSVQPRGTLAWNFALGLFYKAGGYPWRLAQVREGTMYVGISFYRERGWDPITMGTAVAQVFDQSGEGLVLRGARIEWDRRANASPHLPVEAAAELVKRVLSTYRLRRKSVPERVVFHKTSRYWPDELKGLQSGLPGDVSADFLSIERSNLRLVREGRYPPVRGTCVTLSPREYLVYGMGYIPYLRTYPGHHVPSPLHVLEHVGPTTPQQVCAELIALTKLNWNTAQYCCGVPMTINVARRVSSVLAELPEGVSIDPSYRYYM